MEVLEVHKDFDLKFSQNELQVINGAINYFLECRPSSETSVEGIDLLDNLNLLFTTLLAG